MVPPIGGQAPLSLDSDGVVQPAHHQVDVDPAFQQGHPVSLFLFQFQGPREDGAALFALGVDPGAQGESVVEAEVAEVSGIDEAAAVETAGLTDLPRGESRPAVLESGLGLVPFGGCREGTPPTAGLSIQGKVSQQSFRNGPVEGAPFLEGGLPLPLGTVQFRFQGREVLLGSLQFLLQLGKLLLLPAGGRLDHGRRIAVLVDLAALGDVVEEGEGPIKLLLAEGIVLVVVAAGAAQGEAQPDGGRGLHPVHHVLDGKFVCDDAALAVAPVVAIEAGGDPLFQGGLGEHVPGQLLHGEAIEGHVGIKGLDHPVPPAPHGPFPVRLIAVAVRITGRVQPAQGHVLAVARGPQQAVHHLLVGAGKIVAQKGIHLFRRGGQPRQIQRDPANENRLVGRGGGVQPLLPQSVQHEEIDRVAGPALIGDLGQRRPLGGDKGPVALPPGPLLDPQADEIDLLFVELEPGVGRGHAESLLLGGDALEHLAPVRIAGEDGPVSAQVGEGSLPGVEAQLGGAGRLVGPVAGVAAVGQEGTDVAVELHRRLPGTLRPGGRSRPQDQARHHPAKPSQPQASLPFHGPTSLETFRPSGLRGFFRLPHRHGRGRRRIPAPVR